MSLNGFYFDHYSFIFGKEIDLNYMLIQYC
jgi:hypothetical protein